MLHFIAEHLSVRLIIVQARRALVGPQSEVVLVYVCMSVRNGFTIEIYGFMHRVRTFGLCRSGCHRDRTMAWRSRLRTRKIEYEARIQMYGRRLTAEQKHGRRQDNSDKKRLAHHYPSDLLRSLTREQIDGGQHGVVSPALQASPFRTFHVLRVRHLMRMRIPSTKGRTWVLVISWLVRGCLLWHYVVTLQVTMCRTVDQCYILQYKLYSGRTPL